MICRFRCVTECRMLFLICLHKLLLTRSLHEASFTALRLYSSVHQSGLPGITSHVVTDAEFSHMVQQPSPDTTQQQNKRACGGLKIWMLLQRNAKF